MIAVAARADVGDLLTSSRDLQLGGQTNPAASIANCLGCGTTITVTTRNTNRRYCSPRCRKAAWQARARRTNHRVGGEDVVGAGGAVPHCRQEIAPVAVVIPADAARGGSYPCSYSTPPTTTDHSTRNSWQP
jgi:endogenous inhibitor of DNA gyrase (YacG/DUF329 family)